jgi:5,10-methylene-tetrahydrofolate dehydrogenase/methenyl tetrahydrofolate cyclohydrolase
MLELKQSKNKGKQMTKHSEPIPFMGVVEIDDDEPYDRSVYVKTQQEVADALGITRNAVGQTENRALKKFKELFLSKFNKDDFI